MRVGRLTILSVYCYLIEEVWTWTTTVAGTWGFLGENAQGPSVLHFPIMSTGKKY